MGETGQYLGPLVSDPASAAYVGFQFRCYQPPENTLLSLFLVPPDRLWSGW
jgi:hypothetical protein